jgi:hypothetical protein
MTRLSYEDVLEEVADNPVIRDVCIDEECFADVLAEALKNHPAPPPTQPPDMTNALQGNLSEFGIWDMGEKYWELFERRMTWSANADSPWKGSSSDGIDILALVSDEDELVLFVIEVKSSDGCGSNLVTGGNSSLQSDFDRLFDGPVQNRLIISVGRVLASLRFVHDRTDLEEQVKDMVGTRPTKCPSLRLIAVLVCNQGTTRDEQARERAFQRLAIHLTDVGWDESQITFRTVETNGVVNLLENVIEKATS